MSTVSINLVTWNGEKYIENCIKSVLNQTFKDYSIIIIDNGSADSTVEIIRERFPHLKIIQHKENIGFAKAHNQAIHWTKSKYVLVLNQDVVLKEDYVENAVKVLEENPQAGSITGKILRLQEEEPTNYIDTAGLRLNKNYQVTEIGAGEMDEGQYDAIEEIFGVSGAIPVYRRKALEQIAYQKEYFDELFFSYKEDVDLAHRLRLAGWQAWRASNAVAYHDRTVSSPQERLSAVKVAKNWRGKSKFSKFYSYRNHLYFLKKNLLKMNWFVFRYEFAKFLFVLFFETRNIKAWVDYFRNSKELKAKRKIIQKNKKIKEEELLKWIS